MLLTKNAWLVNTKEEGTLVKVKRYSIYCSKPISSDSDISLAENDESGIHRRRKLE